MIDPLTDKVLERFKLNDNQRTAAIERGKDVVVTAGAGSGKTLTLVARYTSLLAEGLSPRRMAAITFTKKAAREMRSRVRIKLLEMQQITGEEQERQKWTELSAQMDSARIGTIHSLCTEILRSHPAEAGIDPRFTVLDEGLSAALRIQAVDDSLMELVEENKFLPLLQNISLTNLTEMLQYLLEHRIDAEETLTKRVNNRDRLVSELNKRLNSPAISEPINDLRGMTDYELQKNGGKNLAFMVKELLELWEKAEEALTKGDPILCAASLYQARREKMNRKPGSAGYVKETISLIQETYDRILNPLVGGKDPKIPPPSIESERLFEQLLPSIIDAFERVREKYKQFLDSRQALDFDDLEYGAQQLLRRVDIRARWHGELDAILVDEFQDTNQRQREIINALAGTPGRLFIVGDMRQSIYRFRRADVTVFSDEQSRIRREGGLLVDLDRTYRAHEPLLQATGDLLSRVIGTDPDPDRPYFVPFTPLIANAKSPIENIKPPHIEMIFGAGRDAESARHMSARALAVRLLQLKKEEQIKKWDEVALLFRAATGFPAYEEAFEEARIPFVTVAGKGFYDRPEIRDLVNILRALADPMDDLSFAGLLRSPAFGLSDAALYLLRQTGLPFWTALQDDISFLAECDQYAASRTRRIIHSLLPMVDRIPVAELLKQVVDAVDYRAILATTDMKTSGQESIATSGRLWRNLDKLLEDAQVSQQVSVRDFLDMLGTLNDAGAREGEAPAEAEGAVRLMTIHKAKGLEFPVVVMADASRGVRSPSEQVYLSDDLGMTFKLDPPPMLYKLAVSVDKDQDECEALRVLYVALTRAKQKLLISAYASYNDENKVSTRAWATKLLDAAEIQPDELIESRGEPFECMTGSHQPLRVWCLTSDVPLPELDVPGMEEKVSPEADKVPLYQPLEEFQEVAQEEVADRLEQLQQWRDTQKGDQVPGKVLGTLVHKAIQLWLSPGDPKLLSLLQAETFNAGITSREQRDNLVERATQLLERLRRHPIWEEINTAQERYTELPYTIQANGKTENRYIDLLYKRDDGWSIVDFKTDPIFTLSYKYELVSKYTLQVQCYKRAIKTLLGADAKVRICFLDDQGKVEIEEVSS